MGPQPAGKVLSLWWEDWAGNGGCVVRNTDDTYQWANNDRHIGLFSDGRMYRTILSFWTPVPSGAAVQNYIRVFVYRDSDFLCGSQVRLLSGSVRGDAEEMFEWIGSGELVLLDANIDSEWRWDQTPQAKKIARKIQAGSVHFGLTPPLDWLATDCSLGKWGLSTAPDWDNYGGQYWVPEPTTYSMVLAVLSSSSSKPLAWQEGVRPAGWGEFKGGAK